MRSNAFFLFARRYFFFIFPIISIWSNYSIEESGHCREVERGVNVCHVWTVRQKNKKNGPCREVSVKEEVDVSSEVRLNITWYYHNFFWNLESSKLQQTVLSNTVILIEINEAILLSIEGYFVCRDRYAVFRKLPHSRKLYLCMNSASRIFFSASFLSVYEVVRTTKKNLRGWLVYIAHQHRTPNEWSKKLCELVSGQKLFANNSAGYKFRLGR